MTVRCSLADDVLEMDASVRMKQSREGGSKRHTLRIVVGAVFPLSHLSELTCPPHNGAGP